jgi:beta-ureidopropionase / N-carbamoyl-L-amino-acid hydrolase
MVQSLILTVNGDRLLASIHKLAQIGHLPNGNIKRLAFTPEDHQARQQVQQWMQAAGMTVRHDAAGNLIGTYAGTQPDWPVLATGSHIDTVPSGGAYDGVLGVLAGIEMVRVLQENQQRLQHPIEVIVFTDEESSMIGCQAMAGTVVKAPTDYQTATGQAMPDCLAALGGDWAKLATAQRNRSQMAAFVELHVEQGAVLERQGRMIGVVQGVVGMQRYALTIVGQANHAGTTPMLGRQDALVAAAQVILAVQQMALAMPSQPVATVGWLTVTPNAVNIVPGQVELTIDMRDLSQTCLNEMFLTLQQKLEFIAVTTRTTMTLKPILCVPPSLAALAIQDAITAVCKTLNLSYCHLPSRAGHDALEMGRCTDMGMIFVPSQAGLSHSGDEYTSPEQCIQGANVLLQTLLKLDEIYGESQLLA